MTLFSKFAGDSKTIQDRLCKQECIWPLPVSFVAWTTRKVKSKSTSDDKDRTMTQSFDVLLDPNDPDSNTYSMTVPIFEDGTAEDWVTWRILVDDLFTKIDTVANGQKQNQVYMLSLIHI